MRWQQPIFMQLRKIGVMATTMGMCEGYSSERKYFNG